MPLQLQDTSTARPILASLLGCETDPRNRSRPAKTANLTLLSPGTSSLVAHFHFGDDSVCCRGATPEVQLRANGTEERGSRSA